ncbi:unnamed protein product [Enterobius vermicularis]|uniref:PH domain-containing protein n=1 Tax=Enterobius vermicularis TaxID=51028 RepID=A0A0N4V570_ENTVE|nr:unnamed protein product [Enterobius vermicularis]
MSSALFGWASLPIKRVTMDSAGYANGFFGLTFEREMVAYNELKVIFLNVLLFRTMLLIIGITLFDKRSIHRMSSTRGGSLSSLSVEVSATGSIERSGWLQKWTNYLRGYRHRWFVLDSHGILSYYSGYECSCEHLACLRLE